jgi:hypothetical protein
MKQTITIAAFLLSFTACSQPNQEVVKHFKDNILRTSLRKMYFFEPELIALCQDTAIRKKVSEKILQQYNKIQGEDILARKERIIFLTLLRNRIKGTNTQTVVQDQSKQFLLAQFFESKINFTIDDKLMEERTNPKKRGLPFGDEECDEEFSYLVFFLHDPSLYVSVMKHSKIANPSRKMMFPTTCTLKELNNSPILMKRRVQSELLKILNAYQGSDYNLLKQIIRDADLNAKYD